MDGAAAAGITDAAGSFRFQKRGMRVNLDPCIVQKLRELAAEHGVEKLVLFGSRARGTNHAYRDIDLAVWGIRDAGAYLDFQEAVEEQVPTLLRFDFADMQGIFASDALREEAGKDGIVIYEKI